MTTPRPSPPQGPACKISSLCVCVGSSVELWLCLPPFFPCHPQGRGGWDPPHSPPWGSHSVCMRMRCMSRGPDLPMAFLQGVGAEGGSSQRPRVEVGAPPREPKGGLARVALVGEAEAEAERECVRAHPLPPPVSPYLSNEGLIKPSGARLRALSLLAIKRRVQRKAFDSHRQLSDGTKSPHA